MNGFFVTGTDTDIGKTLCSGALLLALAAQGKRVAGMKPIAAGCTMKNGKRHNDDVSMHEACSNVVIAPELRCPYLLNEPTSPHIAAAQENVTIDIRHLLDCARQIAAQTDLILVEGVGGFRVPLGPALSSADLAVALDLPVILVVGMRLGCINHALLSMEAIAHRGLSFAGWIANCVDPQLQHNQPYIDTLRTRLNAPLLGTIPYLPQARAEEASKHLNISTLLNI